MLPPINPSPGVIALDRLLLPSGRESFLVIDFFLLRQAVTATESIPPYVLTKNAANKIL